MSENKQVLKMCPFCGADAKLEQPRGRAGISCTECGCRTPLMHSVADALAIWNERPAVLSASAGEKVAYDADIEREAALSAFNASKYMQVVRSTSSRNPFVDGWMARSRLTLASKSNQEQSTNKDEK